MYIPTMEDYDLFSQHIKNISVKIEILNSEFAVIDYIIGNLISDSFSINVDSDIRRTISLVLRISKEYDMLDETKKIWLNKLIRVWIGEEVLSTGKIKWYNFGTMTFDNVTYTTNTTDYTLQINCIDLVAFLNGSIKGTITSPVKIPAYDEETKEPITIFEALKYTITQLGGLSKYNIYDNKLEIPYDLEFDAGSSVWDIVTEINSLQAGYECFFDEEGTFFYKPIPTTENDPVVLSEGMMKQITINEQITDDVTTVKNIIKVYGQTLDADSTINISNVTTNTTNGDTKIEYRNMFTFKSNDPSNISNNIYFIVNNFTINSTVDLYSNEVYAFNIDNYNLAGNSTNGVNSAVLLYPNNFLSDVQNNPNGMFTILAKSDKIYYQDPNYKKVNNTFTAKQSAEYKKRYKNFYQCWTSNTVQMLMYECFNSTWDKKQKKVIFQVRPLNNQYVVNYININNKSVFANSNEYNEFWGIKETSEEIGDAHVKQANQVWGNMSKKERKKYGYNYKIFLQEFNQRSNSESKAVRHYYDNYLGKETLSSTNYKVRRTVKQFPTKPAYNITDINTSEYRPNVFVVANMPETYNNYSNFIIGFQFYEYGYNTFADLKNQNKSNTTLFESNQVFDISDPNKKHEYGELIPKDWKFNNNELYVFEKNSESFKEYEAGWTST